ncbi:hypothetical protein [Rubritalea tangerina]|uniref:Uncharacterized protein n=1 Tax=Rubritalea tangerina TaxID=430798 RepID=A0ABW4ZFA9_9BACT
MRFLLLFTLALCTINSFAEIKKTQPSGFMLRGTPEMKVRPLRGTRSAFVPPVNGVDATLVFAEWNDLQPTRFGPIASNNIIDRAISAVSDWNQQHPDNPVTIRLRTFAGIYAPDWVMQHAGSVPIDYRKKQDAKPLIRRTPKFWTPEYKEAWLDLQTKLAAKYDKHPLIADVSISGSMTLHTEVMWRQASFPHVLKSLRRAGLSEEQDLHTLKQDITLFMETWPHTPLEITFNTQRECSINENQITRIILRPQNSTILLNHLHKEANRLNKRYMIGNHSLSEFSAIHNKKSTDPKHIHSALKKHRHQFHTPLYFQTEVFSAHLASPLIHEAINMGASLIELPNDISQQQIQSLQNLRIALKNQASSGLPAKPTHLK